MIFRSQFLRNLEPVKLIFIVCLIILIVYALYVLYTGKGYSEGFQMAEENVNDFLILVEEKVKKQKEDSAKLTRISDKLIQGTDLSEGELEELANLYNNFQSLKSKSLGVQLGDEEKKKPLEQLTNLIKVLEKTKEILEGEEKLFTGLFKLLEGEGYIISFDETGNLVKLQKKEGAPSRLEKQGEINLEIPGEAEKLLYSQLVKKIKKLRDVNEENISYYKKLNKEQQEILTGIIEKRNREIERLRKMLEQVRKRLAAEGVEIKTETEAAEAAEAAAEAAEAAAEAAETAEASEATEAAEAEAAAKATKAAKAAAKEVMSEEMEEEAICPRFCPNSCLIAPRYNVIDEEAERQGVEPMSALTLAGSQPAPFKPL